MSDCDRTVDGIRLRPARVSRSLVLRFGSEVVASRWAADLGLLGCRAVRDGAVVTVTGKHDVLSDIERLLT